MSWHGNSICSKSCSSSRSPGATPCFRSLAFERRLGSGACGRTSDLRVMWRKPHAPPASCLNRPAGHPMVSWPQAAHDIRFEARTWGFITQPRTAARPTRRRRPPLIPGPDQGSREGDGRIIREVGEALISSLCDFSLSLRNQRLGRRGCRNLSRVCGRSQLFRLTVAMLEGTKPFHFEPRRVEGAGLTA